MRINQEHNYNFSTLKPKIFIKESKGACTSSDPETEKKLRGIQTENYLETPLFLFCSSQKTKIKKEKQPKIESHARRLVSLLLFQNL